MLAPEQVERKINAVFGQPWGRLQEQLAILYGGIDSKEVTERAADPSGAMGAIQRTLANDVACKHILRDFALQPAERRLFPGIEPNVLPGSSPDADAAIRKAIVHLHELVLGRHDAADSAEVIADLRPLRGDRRRREGGTRARQARELLTAGPTCPTPPTTRTTRSAPGAAW